MASKSTPRLASVLFETGFGSLTLYEQSTAVDIIRSSVSLHVHRQHVTASQEQKDEPGSVLYSSLQKSLKYDSVVLRTSKSWRPASTVVSSLSLPFEASTMTCTSRLSSPSLTNECLCGLPSTLMRDHLSCVIETSAFVTWA